MDTDAHGQNTDGQGGCILPLQGEGKLGIVYPGCRPGLRYFGLSGRRMFRLTIDYWVLIIDEFSVISNPLSVLDVL
jgi:hypothetical protein